MCATPSVVRRIVASNVGGTSVVVVVVVVVGGIVDVVVVVVVFGEVGSGIDSGPSPGVHATATEHNATATASRLVVTLALSYTRAHSARSERPELCEDVRSGGIRGDSTGARRDTAGSRLVPAG